MTIDALNNFPFVFFQQPHGCVIVLLDHVYCVILSCYKVRRFLLKELIFMECYTCKPRAADNKIMTKQNKSKQNTATNDLDQPNLAENHSYYIWANEKHLVAIN